MTTDRTHPRGGVEAASDIVRGLRRNRRQRYFAAFAPDATFVFHTEPARLDDRATYEPSGPSWVDGGWRVTSCTSSDQLAEPFPGGAVFSHSVDTTRRDRATAPKPIASARPSCSAPHDDGCGGAAPRRCARAPLPNARRGLTTRHPDTPTDEETSNVALHPPRARTRGTSDDAGPVRGNYPCPASA